MIILLIQCYNISGVQNPISAKTFISHDHFSSLPIFQICVERTWALRIRSIVKFPRYAIAIGRSLFANYTNCFNYSLPNFSIGNDTSSLINSSSWERWSCALSLRIIEDICSFLISDRILWSLLESYHICIKMEGIITWFEW